MDIPTASATSMVLLFNASESLMVPAPGQDDPEGRAAPSDRDRRLEGALVRVKLGAASRRDQETLLESYTSFEDGMSAERREFMGRTFLISGPRPSYRWTLGGEQREFMGHMVQKATTEDDGAAIEAWFTPEIPVPAGPGPYGGLPGAILVLTVDAGKTVYSATEIALGDSGDEAISPPNEGEMVTRTEYERIVAEKLEEVQTLRGPRRGRRPPFR